MASMAIEKYSPLFYDQPPPLRNIESFPNAEKIFRYAYGLSDPTPELLNLIKAHPTEAAVRGLFIYYIDAAVENPSRAYALASVLVALRDSPDAPLIQGDSSLAMAFHVGLADLHSGAFYFDDYNRTFSPTNTYSTDCLLSALSLKHNLTSCPVRYVEVRDGLDCHGNSSIYELWVIGACIQLLTPIAHHWLEKRFKNNVQLLSQ